VPPLHAEASISLLVWSPKTWRATSARPHQKVLVNRLIGERKDLEANFANMYNSTWTESRYNLLCDYTIDLAGRCRLAVSALFSTRT